jgi:hypothetical protein
MLPRNIETSLQRYANSGVPTGSFLYVVLCNNLFEAMNKADYYNRENLFDICMYIYNELPSTCHGSPERVNDWIEGKRAERITQKPKEQETEVELMGKAPDILKKWQDKYWSLKNCPTCGHSV